MPALTFEQGPQSEVVIDAEHRLDIRRLGNEIGKQRTAQRDRGWRGRCDNTSRVEQRGVIHGGLITFEAPLHPWIHARAEETDPPVSLLEKMGNARAGGVI